MKNNFLWILIVLLSAIGAINWGLIGLFDLDLVKWLLGSMPIVVKSIYILVGICGVLLLIMGISCPKKNNLLIKKCGFQSCKATTNK